jgi:hypothetical protein
MARSYLQEANLPRKFWFWALRTAFERMNMIPLNVANAGDAPVHVTPFELFYSCKPDLRTLFPFGSVGYFRREADSINGEPTARTKFQAQTFPGIAVGRSKDANGMLFWSPETLQFSVASDYTLDPYRQVRTHFPELLNDGGFTLSVLTPDGEAHTGHSLGDIVLFQPEGPETADGEAPVIGGTIVSLPVPNVHPKYRVEWENGHCSDVDGDDLFDPSECEEHELTAVTSDPSHRDPIHPLPPRGSA